MLKKTKKDILYKIGQAIDRAAISKATVRLTFSVDFVKGGIAGAGVDIGIKGGLENADLLEG